MADFVSIVNDAFGNIGVKARIQGETDAGVPAAQAAAAFAAARDEMLERRRWSFAEKRHVLEELPSEELPTGWAYAFQAPSDMVAPREFWSGNVVDTPDTQRIYTMAHGDNGTVFFTNEPEPELVYTAKVTQPVRFPPLFARALSWRIAERLAPSMAESLAWWNLAAKNAAQAESEAWASDLNTRRKVGDLRAMNRYTRSR